jgi:hypothetical protein
MGHRRNIPQEYFLLLEHSSRLALGQSVALFILAQARVLTTTTQQQ